jgi:hypothetical protein
MQTNHTYEREGKKVTIGYDEDLPRPYWFCIASGKPGYDSSVADRQVSIDMAFRKLAKPSFSVGTAHARDCHRQPGQTGYKPANMIKCRCCDQIFSFKEYLVHAKEKRRKKEAASKPVLPKLTEKESEMVELLRGWVNGNGNEINPRDLYPVIDEYSRGKITTIKRLVNKGVLERAPCYQPGANVFRFPEPKPTSNPASDTLVAEQVADAPKRITGKKLRRCQVSGRVIDKAISRVRGRVNQKPKSYMMLPDGFRLGRGFDKDPFRLKVWHIDHPEEVREVGYTYQHTPDTWRLTTDWKDKVIELVLTLGMRKEIPEEHLPF